jgi:hypothetical protein
MIYIVKKFWHYLLGNNFIFSIKALLPLVNKSVAIGWIAQSLLLL